RHAGIHSVTTMKRRIQQNQLELLVQTIQAVTVMKMASLRNTGCLCITPRTGNRLGAFIAEPDLCIRIALRSHQADHAVTATQVNNVACNTGRDMLHKKTRARVKLLLAE